VRMLIYYSRYCERLQEKFFDSLRDAYLRRWLFKSFVNAKRRTTKPQKIVVDYKLEK